MRISKFNGLCLGRASGLTLACLGLFLGSSAGAAVDLTSIDKAAGSYEIALHDTGRRCTLLLRRDDIGAGRRLAMPAGCRRALPILTDAGVWTLTRNREITFADQAGQTLLTFAGQDTRTLFARGPEGETYELMLSDERERVAEAPGTGIREVAPANAPAATSVELAQSVSPIKPKPRPLPAQPATPVPASEPQGGPIVPFTGRQDDVAGRYIIMREGSRDVGCMLTLDATARGLGGGLKAQLAPACRDQGIVVFDPVAWRFERGRIFLTARKGHQAGFEGHADGIWWKDPQEGGKPLGIKKL